MTPKTRKNKRKECKNIFLFLTKILELEIKLKVLLIRKWK